MKKTIFLFALPFFFTGIISCSSDDSKETNEDSIAKNKADTNYIFIETDSGRLEIEKLPEHKEAKAFLKDANGKTVQTGMFYDNKPAGAWVKYDASGKVVSAFHYSNGKPLHKLDKNDFQFRSWSSKAMGIEIKVPQNWAEQTFPSTELIAFQKPISDTSVHIKPNFSIERAAVLPGENLEKLAFTKIQILHENVGRIQVIEENNFVVDSVQAFRRYGMFFDGNTQIGFLSVIIISGQNVWYLNFEAENKNPGDFLKYQGVFQDITDSFRRLN